MKFFKENMWAILIPLAVLFVALYVFVSYESRSQQPDTPTQQVQQPTQSPEDAIFVAENANRKGVTVTESGLQYEVITSVTSGDSPSATDEVEVRYTGTFIDGNEFDSSGEETITFPLNQVISGWTEGLQLMKVGETFRFVIPSDLAYGDRGRPGIPGGATLVFEVELVSIK